MSLTLTYVTLEEAKELNPRLEDIADSDLTRLLYVSEVEVDSYVGLGVPEGQSRVFPRPGNTDIPDEVKLATALTASEVQAREQVGDPTMGGLISEERALERNIKYGKSASAASSAISYTVSLLLAKFRPSTGGSEITGFDLTGQRDSWLDPMGNGRPPLVPPL